MPALLLQATLESPEAWCAHHGSYLKHRCLPARRFSLNAEQAQQGTEEAAGAKNERPVKSPQSVRTGSCGWIPSLPISGQDDSEL